MAGEREDGGGGKGGAGGKMRRWPLASRPPAATPYDRPQPPSEREREASHRLGSQEDERGRGLGWLSKAKLLLSPASRLMPPSSPPTAAAVPLRAEEDGHVNIAKIAVHSQASHTDVKESSDEGDFPNDNIEINEHSGGISGNTCIQSGLADIEKRLKQRIFSRDESNHLIEILCSRTIGLHKDHRHEIGLTTQNAGNQFEEKFLKVTTMSKGPAEIGYRLQKQGIFNEVGASPVEIAKVFMESRPSSSSSNIVHHGGNLEADKVPLHKHESPNSSVALTSQVSQIFNSGTTMPTDHGYFTPHSQRGIPMPQNIPQTPFPRASHGRPSTKFQHREQCPGSPFTGWKQSTTPIFSTKKRRISTPGDDLMAVSPSLEWEQENMTSAFKDATPYQSSSSRPSLASRFDILGDTASTTQMILEPGASRSSIIKDTVAYGESDSFRVATELPRVHPKSSEVARKILEHIDRAVPSAKTKSLKSSFPVESVTLPPSDIVINRTAPSSLRKLLEPNFPIDSKTLPSSRTSKMFNDQDNKPCPDFPKTKFLPGDIDIGGSAEVKKSSEGVRTCYDTGFALADTKSHEIPKSLFLRQAFGSESASKEISNFKAKNPLCFRDNDSAFAFPASLASDTCRNQTIISSASGGTSPSFNFGPVGGRPTFTLLNTINASAVGAATSIPPYRFGSDDSSRLSFRSFVEDATCH